MRRSQHEWHIPKGGRHYGTLESPEEITVYCTCGEWVFESIASAGGPCDTDFGPDFEAHINDMDYE